MSNVPSVAELQKIFFGRSTPAEFAYENTYTATVLQADGVYCTVVLDVPVNFQEQPVWKARYERRLTLSGGNAVWASPPPAKTRCVICFPQNESDHSPWVLTFVGYP